MSEELFQTSLDAIDRAQARTLRLMCRGLLLENRASIAEIRALKARITRLELLAAERNKRTPEHKDD